MNRIILTFCLFCGYTMLHAQQDDVRVNEVFQQTRMTRVLNVLESKYNAKIAYDYSLVQDIVVSLTLKDLSVAATLDKLLEGTPLTASTVGADFVIIPRPVEAIRPSITKISVRLSGRVIDDQSGETLPMATVLIAGTALATSTNNDGHFTLLNIPNDTCTLEVRYLGYLTRRIRVQDIDENNPLLIKLKSDANILNEVVVLDEYNQAVHIEALPGSIVFNAKSLSTLPSLGEQDIFRTMQTLPGVSATDESSSGMVIRGSHPSYNLTTLDGMTIYQQDHFFGSFSIVNADIIKDVRVHKGMFDAKYGGRVSGLVDITTKDGNTVKPAFNVKMNFVNIKATAELPIGKKWSLIAGVRRSFTDAIQSNLFKQLFDITQVSNDQVQFLRVVGPNGITTPKYYFFDANTKLTFRPTVKDKVSLTLYTSRDKMMVDDTTTQVEPNEIIATRRDEKINWGNNGVSLRWARQWNDRYYSNVRLSASEFFRDYGLRHVIAVDGSGSAYDLRYENSISDLSYAVDNEWLLSDQLSFAFGAAGTRQAIFVHAEDEFNAFGEFPPDDFPDDINFTDDGESWMHSAYASITHALTSKLNITAGGRAAYYYNRKSKVLGEPRISAHYTVSEKLRLKAGFGRSHQFITQLFYFSKAGTISGMNESFWMISEPGKNQRFPIISSDQVTAGATLHHAQFVYDAEVYWKKNTGVIIGEDISNGNTGAYGLDVMVQKTSGIHTGWLAYSLSRGTQHHPFILAGSATPSWQDQRHEFKLIDMLTLGRWNFASTIIYGSGKPYAKYDVNYIRDTNGTIYTYELNLDYTNTSRLPDYFRMDLAVSYTVRFKNSWSLETGFSIHNLTDHRNIKTKKIDVLKVQQALGTTTELPATYNEIVLLGFMPSLSVNLSF